MEKVHRLFTAVAACWFLMAGQSVKAEKIVVGALLLTQQHPFYVLLADAMKKEAEKDGVSLQPLAVTSCPQQTMADLTTKAIGKIGRMSDVLTIGELLAEFMAERVGQTFTEPGTFLGPFPSGAPAMFADQVGTNISMAALPRLARAQFESPAAERNLILEHPFGIQHLLP